MVEVYGRRGVWMWYDLQEGYVAQLISDDVKVVARAQATNKYGSVGFWPFGMGIADAVKWWEELG